MLRRAILSLTVLAMVTLFACSKSISQEVVGPVSVTIATEPNTIEVGPIVLHVQLADPPAIRPLGDVMITAMAGPEAGPLTKQVVVQVATPGASEVRMTMPESGVLKLTLIVRGERGPIGEISYILEAGKKGVRRIATKSG